MSTARRASGAFSRSRACSPSGRSTAATPTSTPAPNPSPSRSTGDAERDSMFRTSGSDFQANAVIVNGTNGNESIRVAGDAFGASVLGLTAQVSSTWAKPGFDRPTVNALDGDDVVAASSLSADAIHFAGDSGAGNDTFTGGAGADVLTGRPGQNQLDGRPSDNILIWV